MACNWGTFLKVPRKNRAVLLLTRRALCEFEKNTHFTKAIILFYLFTLHWKFTSYFYKFFYHKNILLYKSVCINIRGVASCRRNVV